MRPATFVLLGFVLTSCRPPAQNATKPWFEDVAAAAGIQFVQTPHASGQFYMPEIMGSGCALLDYDGDLYGGWLRLELEARLRDERRFAGVPELLDQIQRDIARTRELCP